MPSGETQTVNVGNGGVTGIVIYDNAGLINSDTPPSGFTSTSGGIGSSFVTWTQSTGQGIADFTIGGGAPGSISAYTQGVTEVTGVAEVYTVTVGSSDGTVTLSSGGSVASTGGVIDSVSAPTGFTATSGGATFGYVVFTANSNGAVTDDSISGDSTGGASLTVNTQGVTAVSAVQEQFTYTTGGAISGSGTFGNGGATSSINWTSGLITSHATPTGFTVLSGGAADTTVEFEQTTGAAVADYATLTGGMTTTTTQQGVTEVTEQAGQVIVGWVGAAGWIAYADGFTAIPIPVTASDAAAKALLNAAGGYNGAVIDAVTMTSTSMTADFTMGQTPTGTVTIGGKAGAAVVAAAATLQDGSNYYPQGVFDVATLIPGPTYCFSNAAGTTPCAENDPILCWTATNGLKFTKASASGFSLKKVNDQWVVYTNGTAYLRSTTGGLSLLGSSSMGMLFSTDTASGTQMAISVGVDAGDGQRRCVWIQDLTGFKFNFNGNSSDVQGGAISITTWTRGAITVQQQVADDDISIYVNNGTPATGSRNLAYPGGNDAITIGCNNGTTENYVGYYDVVVLKSSVATTQQLADLDAYLAARSLLISP